VGAVEQVAERGKAIDCDSSAPPIHRRPLPSTIGGACKQPTDSDNDSLAVVGSREGDYIVAVRPVDSQRLIGATRENIGELLPDGEQPSGQRKLDAAIGPSVGKRSEIC
jgi:hypothetical protein